MKSPLLGLQLQPLHIYVGCYYYGFYTIKSSLFSQTMAVRPQVQEPVIASLRWALSKIWENQGLVSALKSLFIYIVRTASLYSYSVGCNGAQELCSKQSKFRRFNIFWANKKGYSKKQKIKIWSLWSQICHVPIFPSVAAQLSCVSVENVFTKSH